MEFPFSPLEQSCMQSRSVPVKHSIPITEKVWVIALMPKGKCSFHVALSSALQSYNSCCYSSLHEYVSGGTY